MDNYNTKFNLAKDSITNTWKIIKNIINSDYKRKQTITEIIDKNEMSMDKNIIPNIFNEYFSNVGSNLANNIPEVKNETVTKYIKGYLPK